MPATTLTIGKRLVRATFALLAATLALPTLAATITGTVFEHWSYGGGAGRSMAAAGGVGIANVRVEFYATNDSYLGATLTDTNGIYSYTYGGHAPRRVRVVNGTIRSARPGGAGCNTCVAVQTYRLEAPSGSTTAITDEVGGRNPALSDYASRTSAFPGTTGTQTIQSWSLVDPNTGGATVSGIDFGFNYDTVVNTRDATNCAPSGSGNSFFPCQGSLRQFIINANALGGEGSLSQDGNGQLDGFTSALPAGFETSIFMIPSAALTANVAVITLAGALPSITGSNTRVDATTQTVNIGNTNPGTLGAGGAVGVDNIFLPAFARPEVQLNCAASGATPVTLGGANQSIIGFALRQGYILLSSGNGTARNNLVGMTAAGSSADNSAGAHGISFVAPNATIRGNYVTVNNSAIRSDGGGTNGLITLNEVGRPTSGHTDTFDGILLINGATGTQITANLVRDQRGGGIELGFGSSTDSYASVTVQNNTVDNNGFDAGSTPSSERLGMVAYNFTGTNVVFSRNRVIDNAGPGLVVLGATGVIATQNSFSNNGGLAIDLDPDTRDPNALGTPNGVTLNDAGDADGGPNGLLNYPVIRSAVIANGELSIGGFARPGSAIELYIAQPDPTGFGEGLTHLGTLIEGVGDLDTMTGTYGPAAVNGVAQGADTTNRFAFRVPVPPGVAIGSVLTSTATLGGQTSEFGGNVFVTAGPSLMHLKSVSALSDPFNAGVNPKSIPGAVQLYTSRITNAGSGSVDNDSLAIVDAIPANTAMYVLDAGGPTSGPVAFVNGMPGSALTYTFSALNSATDDIDFSSDGGASWTHAPAPDANGCDAAITHIRVRPQGAMAPGGAGGNPYFEVWFRVRVE